MIYRILGCLLVCLICLAFTEQANSQQFTLNGNAVSISCDCYRLTTANDNQFGSVWNNNLINLNSSFDFSFDVFLGCNNGGADGLAFVLQPVSTSLGAAGGGLGYAGIAPSLVVEVDTYQNSGDPGSDHVAIMRNGDTNHGGGNNLAGPVQASAGNANVEDCAFHVIRIVWDAPNQTMSVFFDGVFRVSYVGNIVAGIFGGNPNVYWGFTAATGGANNEHRFCLNIVPNFNTAAPAVCSGNPMQFLDASTSNLGAITQWSWNFGDGSPVVNGTATPTHTYSAPGIYNVTLTVNDISGCGASQTFPVTVNPSPQVTAAGDISVCPGTQVALSVNPVDPNLSYAWSPAGQIQNANSPNATFTANATTNITLTITDGNGCSGSDDFLVTVYPQPVADFTVQNHCLGQIVQFSDNSSVANGNIVAWAYNFGDGFGAGIPDPPYIYAAPGTYQTQLQVQDNRGCVGTSAFIPVTVFDLPSPSFTFTDACFGTSNTFNSTSGQAGTAPITITGWDFGDGAQVLGTNVNHTYNAPGTYTVTLVLEDQNTCQNGIQQDVVVFELPVADFTVTNVCIGSQVCPSDNSTATAPDQITTYEWDWGDGTPNDNGNNGVCHTYAAPGVYTITLTVTTANGCVHSTTQQVEVYDNPVASFTFTNVCNGQVLNFANTSTPAPPAVVSNWDFGDGNTQLNTDNGSHTYATDGQYDVILDIATPDGCTASITQQVTVFAAPIVDFVANDDCENIAINFTDNTQINPPATINNFDWDFGDNSNGSGANTTHTYTNDGTFTVTLTVTTSDQCIASISNDITIFPNPNVNFSVAPACEGDDSYFINNSAISSGNIDTYSWDFGNGNTSALVNPAFILPYNAPNGIQSVTLTATSNNGCVSSYTADAIVNQVPTSAFTASPSQACVGTLINFTDNSTAPSGTTITGWDYNFNNFQGLPLPSQHAYTPSASFTYNTALVYNVSLTISTDAGCSNTSVQQVTITPAPFADFVFDYVCRGTVTPFFNISTVSSGTITGEVWDFGDNTNTQIQDPTHLYAIDSVYPVTLTITTDGGCTASVTKDVYVNPLPVVAFSAPGVCEGIESQFANQTTINSGTVVSYEWDFGDSSPLVQDQNPLPHLYSSAGNYNVILTATSDSGCTAVLTQPVSVFPNPTADFSFIQTGDSCLPVYVRFDGSVPISSVPPVVGQTNTIDTFFFQFGDGFTSTSASTANEYGFEGTYDVSLTVTTNNGCTNTHTKPQLVVVRPVPVADFLPEPRVVNTFEPNITFTNMSQGETVYRWNFRDGSRFDYDPSPTHAFVDTGCYDVRLTVSNQFGCSDSTEKEICVIPYYTLYVPNAFTVNEDTKNMIFNAKGEGVKEYEMRIFNRWGEEVFRTKSLEYGWDGTVQSSGMDAPQAVYTYLIRTMDFNDDRYQYYGFVTLLR